MNNDRLPGIAPRALVEYVQERIKKEGAMHCDKRVFIASMTVLRSYLGSNWVKKRIPWNPYFQNPDMGLATDKYRAQFRISTLAEMLVNMQHVEGIGQYISDLREKDLESTVAELGCAARIQQIGAQFKFVKRTGVKGFDYDIEMMIDGSKVSCEIKCKIESTKPGVRTFVDALELARKQVPADTPNVVFIRLPEQWMISEEGHVAYSSGIHKFLLRDRCFASVIIHADDWRTLGESGALCVTRFLHYSNPNALIYLPASIEGNWINRSLDGEKRWLAIDDIVCDRGDVQWRYGAYEVFRRHEGKGTK